MAQKYFERQNSYKRTSQRSSSVGHPVNPSQMSHPDMQYNLRNPPPSSPSNYDPRSPSRMNDYPQPRGRQMERERPRDDYQPRGPPQRTHDVPDNYRNPQNELVKNDIIRQSTTSTQSRRQTPVEPDMDNRIPVVLPQYELPPRWMPANMRTANSEYEIDIAKFMPRKVYLFRKGSEPFGFHIRGGYNLSCGVFVSVVLKNSLAERQGLQIKDLILSVNGRDFKEVNYKHAVELLRSANKLDMLVRSFPAGYDVSLIYEKSPDTSRWWNVA